MIALETVMIAAGSVTALIMGGWILLTRHTVTQWSAIAQADIERAER